MSYRKKHVKSKIHGIRPKKSILTKLWFWIIILVLFIMSGIFYLMFFYSGLQVKDIIISGNEKVKTQDLQEIAFDETNIKLLDFWNIKIISKSILFADVKKIKSSILEKYPTIETIVINKKLPSTILMGVVERKPIGIFCSLESSEQVDKQCFSIDSAGVIFEPTSTGLETATIVRQVGSEGEILTGEKVVAKNIIEAIYKIQKNLKDNFQIDLREALIASPVRLNIRTNENWQIYFALSATANIDLQITKLNLLLGNEISSDKRGSLRYVDLRPKDRAIICNNMECGG